MSRRWFSSSVLALALIAAMAAAVVDLARQAPLNVLIVTMESTRASDFTAENLPKTFAAAETGLRFTSHRTISAWTAPNIIALLGGVSPYAQGVHARDQALPADSRLPLEDLAKAGWRVAGLQSFMAVGVFDHLGVGFEPGKNLLPWLAALARAQRPFVLWHHYLETHLPYAPPESHRPVLDGLIARTDAAARARIEAVMTQPVIPASSVAFKPSDRAAIRALYLGNLRAFDDWFGNLWSFLERAGLLENTVVVLTADHGEELLERGHVGHASTTRAGHLYEEIVRVPLVLWAPKRLGIAVGVVERETHHPDIAATVMRLLGKTPSRPIDGRDLFAEGERAWDGMSSRAGYAEPDPARVTQFVYARKEGRWKLHIDMAGDAVTRRALYDLDADSGERTDVSAREVARAQRMEAAILAKRAIMRPPSMAQTHAAIPVERPIWIFPRQGAVLGYDDFGGRIRLEWRGVPDGAYVIAYEAGTGAQALSGELSVTGAVKDFGKIERAYWNRFIVPYRNFRVRVGVAGRPDLWSEWLELEAQAAP